MQKYFKFNINLILIIYLIIQPFIDLITSLLVMYTNINLTMGMVLRISFLTIVVLYCIAVNNLQYKKYILMYFLAVFIYSCVYLVYSTLIKDASVIFLEAKFLLKSFYLPLLLVCLIAIFQHKGKRVDSKYVIFVGIMYIVLILLTLITNTGFLSYTCDRLGSKGWFYAANEVGAIISIIFPVLIFEVISNLDKCKMSKKITYLTTVIAYIIVALWIGTKVPLLAIILTFIMLMLISLLRAIISKQKKYPIIVTIASIIMLVAIFVTLPYTPVGRNLNDCMQGALFSKSKTEKKINFTNVVFSNRDVYLRLTFDKYMKKPVATKVLGLGMMGLDVDGTAKPYKGIEMDFYEIFYRFGILGFIVYFAPILLIVKIIVALFKKCKESVLNDTIMGYSIALFLSFGIAFFAGHVLTAPSVSVYVALFIACLFNMALGKNYSYIKIKS